MGIAVIPAQFGRQVGGLEGEPGCGYAANRDAADKSVRRRHHQNGRRVGAARIQQGNRRPVGMTDKHLAFDNWNCRHQGILLA